MKKIMIMLAAVCMAVAANATTFSWGISGNGALDAETYAGGTAYLFYATGSTLSLPDTSSFATKTSFTQADITSAGAALFETGTVEADGTFYTTLADNLESLGGSTGFKKFYMAIISDDGKSLALVTSTKTARIAAATTAGSAAWGTTAFSHYTAAAETPDTPAIPEPTSGLLMLVGLAGLALRRRRA